MDPQLVWLCPCSIWLCNWKSCCPTTNHSGCTMGQLWLSPIAQHGELYLALYTWLCNQAPNPCCPTRQHSEFCLVVQTGSSIALPHCATSVMWVCAYARALLYMCMCLCVCLYACVCACVHMHATHASTVGTFWMTTRLLVGIDKVEINLLGAGQLLVLTNFCETKFKLANTVHLYIATWTIYYV